MVYISGLQGCFLGQSGCMLGLQGCIPAASGYGYQHNTTQHNIRDQETVQHNTAQHSIAQHNTAQHSTTQHSTAQHSTAQHRSTQHNKAQHTTHHITAYHNATQRNTRHHNNKQHNLPQCMVHGAKYINRKPIKARERARDGPTLLNTAKEVLLVGDGNHLPLQGVPSGGGAIFAHGHSRDHNFATRRQAPHTSDCTASTPSDVDTERCLLGLNTCTTSTNPEATRGIPCTRGGWCRSRPLGRHRGSTSRCLRRRT